MSDGAATGAGAKRTVRVGGLDVAYHDRGEGPTVVLLHGLGLSADIWRPHLEPLARAGYRVVAPDAPGFGDSPGPRLGLAVADAAVWLERFARALDIERAAWVGHSASCQVILRLASRRADLVAACVLAAPTGEPGPRLARQLIGLTKEVVREPFRVVLRVVRQYLRAPLPTIGTWFRVNRHHPLLDAELVSAPVLVVLGADDPIVHADFGLALARRLQDGRVARIHGAAHAVAVSPIEPFLEQTVAFLDRCYRGGESSDSWNRSDIAGKSQGSDGP